MKFVKRLLLGLLIFIFLVILGGYLYLKSTAPDYSGSLKIAGLNEQVDIHFDKFGIPHIYAENQNDAYFALGYVHAQDRLFQMEIIRRLVSGKMSAILGPQLLETDKRLLTLGIRDAAEKSADKYLSSLDQPYQRAADAYLKGINYFQETGDTPLEFTLLGIKKQAFTMADIYTTLGYMSLGFSAAIKEEPYTNFIKEKLGLEYLEDWHINTGIQRDSMNHLLSSVEPSVKDPFSFMSIEKIMKDLSLPLWTGSNGWVMSADRSESGKVLLANDTHIAHSQPSVWYEAHINYPGFEFYGNFLATVPFGVIGHNRNLGWGLTIFPLDNLDLYREKRNPNNKEELWVDDHWEKMKVREEIIKVKDGEDVNFKVYYSRHGAIINDINPVLKNDSEPVSLWWQATKEPSQAIPALYHMNNAQNIESFRKGLPMVDIIGLNVLYGDTENNIAWWATGKMPKHKSSTHSKFILDGASGKDEILGYYTFSDNPHIINPPSGVIASANNEPKSDVADGVMFPGYYCPSNRFERVSELLAQKRRWKINDFKHIQLDVKSAYHLKNMKIIYQSLMNQDKVSKEGFSGRVLNIMKDWDGKYTYISKGPLVYQKMIYHVMKQAVKDEMPKDSYDKMISTYLFKNTIPKILANKKSPWWDDRNTEQVESRSDIIKRAFDQSLAELEQQYGENTHSWKWVDHHTMTHVHPIGRKEPFDKVFNVGPFSVEGGNGVPNKLEFINNSSGSYEVVSGPAIRLLIDFSDIEHSENIIPTGQSGNVMSPHYQDQALLYATGKYRKQLMNKKEIVENSTLLTLLKK